MLSQERASVIAAQHAHSVGRNVARTVTELERGWYFRWESDGLVGSHGLAVSKSTGDIYQFGSAFPIDRDLSMYDHGMDADRHDLVVLRVADFERSLAVLETIGPTVVELTYESGTVWRVPRRLTTDELRERLRQLPAIFPDLQLYFRFEAVEEARASGCFDFDLLPRRP